MDGKTRKQEQNKANYERNRERIKQRNLERYHAQKNLKVSGDTASAGSDLQQSAEKILVPARRPEKAGRHVPKLRLLSVVPTADQDNGPDQAEIAKASRVLANENGRQPDDTGPPAKSDLELQHDGRQFDSIRSQQFQNENANFDLKKSDHGTGFSAPVPGSSRKILNVVNILFRLSLVIGVTFIEIILLKNFLEVLETSREMALPLAIVAALSLQSLTLMTFSGFLMNLVRHSIFGAMFTWMIASQGYHVFFQTRSKLESSAPSSRLTDLEKREADARSDLEWAKKTKSWQDVKTFSESLRATQAAIDALPRTEILGVTNDRAVGMGTFLMIILRGLLLGVSSLLCARLRQDLGELSALPEKLK
jgi:hypothetical protein